MEGNQRGQIPHPRSLDCTGNFVIHSRGHSAVHVKLTNLLIITVIYTTKYECKQQGYKAKQKVRKLGNSRTICLGNISLVKYLHFDLGLQGLYLFTFFPLHRDAQKGKNGYNFTNSHIKCQLIIIRDSCRTPVIAFIFIAQMEGKVKICSTSIFVWQTQCQLCALYT